MLFFFFFQSLEINWTGMTNLLDSPAFRLDPRARLGESFSHWSAFWFSKLSSAPSSSLSENTIMDIIASLMVLPNRMCVPLIDQVKVDQMRFPLPRVCEIILFVSQVNLQLIRCDHLR